MKKGLNSMNKPKAEYFEDYHFHNTLDTNIWNVPKHFYPQERDWTCSIAVLRTILSSFSDVASEDEIIEKYGFKEGPHYSCEIQEKNVIDSKKVRVYYGCNYRNSGRDFSEILNLLKNGYYVAVETMINFDHWVVLLGYSHLGDFDDDMITYYCPYFSEIRTVHFSEFVEMWKSGNYAQNDVVNDFIAVKGRD